MKLFYQQSVSFTICCYSTLCLLYCTNFSFPLLNIRQGFPLSVEVELPSLKKGNCPVETVAGFKGCIETCRVSFYCHRKEFHDLMDKYGSHSDISSARSSPTQPLSGERLLPNLTQSCRTVVLLRWSRNLHFKLFSFGGRIY